MPPAGNLKQLLVKLGINTADWKVAVKDIRSQLNDLNIQAKADYAAQKTKIAEQKAAQEQILTKSKEIQSSSKEQIALKQAEVAQEKLLQAQAATRLANERAIAAAIATQTAQLRQQAVAQAAAYQQQQRAARAQGGGGGGGGQGGGGIFGVLGGIFGAGGASKFGGGVASGVAFGSLFAQGIQLAIGKLYEFGEKIKEFVLEASPQLELVRNTFDRLAQSKGFDSGNFLDKLREATHNLVPDLNLMRLANAAMQSSLKVSDDQVVQLTHNVVALARAQGQDATQAMMALQRGFTTGRYMMLGFITGITRAELQMKHFGAAMTDQERQQAQFNQMLDVTSKKLLLVGDPALTIADRIKILQNEQTRYFQSMAKSLVETSGFRDFLGLLDQAIQFMRQAEERGEGFGKTLGGAFEVLNVLAKSLVSIVMSLKAAFEGLGNAIGGSDSQFSAGLKNFETLSRWLFELYWLITEVTKGAKVLGATWEWANRPISSASLEKYRADVAKISKETADMQMETARRMGLADKLMKEGSLDPSDYANFLYENRERISKEDKEKKRGAAGAGAGGGDSETAQQMVKIARLKVQARQAQEQAEFDVVKQGITDRQQALEEEYNSGSLQLADYVKQRIALREEELIAQKRMFEEEKKSQLELLQLEVKEQQITPEEAAIRRRMIGASTGAKETSATTAADREKNQLALKITSDTRKANEIRSQVELETQAKSLDQQEKLLKDSFNNREISAKEYEAKLDTLWAQELANFTKMEDLKYQGGEKNQVAQANRDKAVADKAAEIDRKRADEQQNIDDQKAKQLDDAYQKQMATMDKQRAGMKIGGIASTFFGTGGTTNENDLIKKQISTTLTYISSLEALRSTVQRNTKDWDDWTSKIVSAQEKVVALTQELSTTAALMGHMTGAIGAGWETLPRTKSVGAGFNAAQTIFTNQTSWQKTSQSMGIPGLNTQSPIVGVGQTLKALFEDVKKGGKNFTDNLDKFGTALGAALQSVGGIMAAFQQTGGFAGAVSGAAGGLGAAKQVGGVLSGLGGALGSIGGAIAGPIGQVVSSVVGAVVGGITGSKRRQQEELMRKMDADFQNMQQELQKQQITLSTAIQQTQQLYLQAAQSASGTKGKKGGDQWRQIAQQMKASLAQLQAQQIQLMHDMNTQIAILSAPTSFQGLLQSVDDIVQKYKEFHGAATNAQELAQANQFLALSMQQLQTTNQQQLLQDYTQAVQDAIQLQDLALQYKQANDQYNAQVYDLMSGGVTTRERTFEQSKLEQLTLMQQQHNLQMQDMAEQLQLQQYKVSSEQQIFQLATTRIGLESQLLALQEQQTNLDMARIAALQQLVTKMQDPNFINSMINFPSASGGVVNDVGILQQLLQQLGLTPASPSTTSALAGTTGLGSGTVEDLMQNLYNTRGRYGQAGFSRTYL